MEIRISSERSTRHYHKNTIQALAWSPDGNFVASASRDQTVRVFDIRAMKEFRVLKGHKKEVCCTSSCTPSAVLRSLMHIIQPSLGTRYTLYWSQAARKVPSSTGICRPDQALCHPHPFLWCQDRVRPSLRPTTPTSGHLPSTRWVTSSSRPPTITPRVSGHASGQAMRRPCSAAAERSPRRRRLRTRRRTCSCLASVAATRGRTGRMGTTG